MHFADSMAINKAGTTMRHCTTLCPATAKPAEKMHGDTMSSKRVSDMRRALCKFSQVLCDKSLARVSSQTLSEGELCMYRLHLLHLQVILYVQ
jgi:hypothetical protein